MARDVSLKVAGRLLEMWAQDDTLIDAWPIDKLVRADPDSPGEEGIFSLGGGAERLVIMDPAVLARLRAAGARVDGRDGWRWVAAGGLAIPAGLLVAWLGVDRLPDLVLPLVPAAMERNLSATVEMLVSKVHHCTGEPGRSVLTGLVARLASAGGLTDTPAIAVLDDDDIKVLESPDGSLDMMRGLIDDAADPDELAGVLAYELSRVRHRDTTRELIREDAVRVLTWFLGWTAVVADKLTSLSRKRASEAAADASALEILDRAGLRADGLGRVMARLPLNEDESFVPDVRFDLSAGVDQAVALRRPPTGASALTEVEWTSVKAICATR